MIYKNKVNYTLNKKINIELKTVKFLMVELNSNTQKYGSSNIKVEKHIRSLGFKMLIKLWPDIVFYKV